ncbi:MAG: hypothetical protein HQ512_12590 [Rhodospirillales bacterium]|nr:hypothetical protein [Rhodospirillales bacterium]
MMLITGGTLGCTLSADENEVVIEYSSPYVGAATALAERHCENFGKSARLVQSGIEKTNVLGFRKKVSVFECFSNPDGKSATSGPKDN